MFCFLLNFFEAHSKESIDGAADWFDNSPTFDQAKKKTNKQNLEKINWRIVENKYEKRSHEWVVEFSFLFISGSKIKVGEVATITYTDTDAINNKPTALFWSR